MSEKYGLDRWLPQLLWVFRERSREIPGQIEVADECCETEARRFDGDWCVPVGAKHVLKWEKSPINDI
jgi:hypothetical protein